MRHKKVRYKAVIKWGKAINQWRSHSVIENEQQWGKGNVVVGHWWIHARTATKNSWS